MDAPPAYTQGSGDNFDKPSAWNMGQGPLMAQPIAYAQPVAQQIFVQPIAQKVPVHEDTPKKSSQNGRPSRMWMCCGCFWLWVLLGFTALMSGVVSSNGQSYCWDRFGATLDMTLINAEYKDSPRPALLKAVSPPSTQIGQMCLGCTTTTCLSAFEIMTSDGYLRTSSFDASLSCCPQLAPLMDGTVLLTDPTDDEWDLFYEMSYDHDSWIRWQQRGALIREEPEKMETRSYMIGKASTSLVLSVFSSDRGQMLLEAKDQVGECVAGYYEVTIGQVRGIRSMDMYDSSLLCQEAIQPAVTGQIVAGATLMGSAIVCLCAILCLCCKKDKH